MNQRRWIAVAGGALAALVVGAAIALLIARALAQPATVTQVPATLPPNGVMLASGPYLLLPPPASLRVSITRADAIALARLRTHPEYRVTGALLAIMSAPDVSMYEASTNPQRWAQISNLPVWLVTLALPQPAVVSNGPPCCASPPIHPRPVSHIVVVLHAETGAFVRGFFTP